MKKLKLIIPIAIAFLLAISIVTIGWLTQEARMTSIKIRSQDSCVGLRIRLTDDSTSQMSNTISVDTDSVALKPCVYADGAFYNASNEVVTTNGQYVRNLSILALPDSACTILASVTVSGNIPIKVMFGDAEITENTVLCTANANGRILEFQLYIDGEEYEQSGSANVEIVLRGVAA